MSNIKFERPDMENHSMWWRSSAVHHLAGHLRKDICKRIRMYFPDCRIEITSSAQISLSLRTEGENAHFILLVSGGAFDP